MRDVAYRVGITERATQAIVADLVAGGYMDRRRVGNRNRYDVHRNGAFRHAMERPYDVGALLDVLAPEP